MPPPLFIACSRVLIVSMGYRMASTEAPAMAPAARLPAVTLHLVAAVEGEGLVAVAAMVKMGVATLVGSFGLATVMLANGADDCCFFLRLTLETRSLELMLSSNSISVEKGDDDCSR